MNVQKAVAKIEGLLQALLPCSGLSLDYALTTGRAEPAIGPAIQVTFHGDDVPALLARNAELLLAFEHIAVKAVGLTSDEHDQISFDAAGFKASRDRHLERSARKALEQVKGSGKPFHFSPMNSRERRLLHLALASSGLATASEGEGALRHLVLHPAREGGIPHTRCSCAKSNDH